MAGQGDDRRNQFPPELLDATGRVGQDVHCVDCGYNLRTLEPDSRCPECSAAVMESLTASRIVTFDRDWLQRFRGATGWVWSGSLLLPGVMILLGVLIGFSLGGPTPTENFLLAGFCLGLLAAPMVLVCGAWLMATLPADVSPGISYSGVRKFWIPGLTVATGVLIVGPMIEVFVGGERIVSPFVALGAICFGILSMSQFVARELQNRKLSKQIRRDSMALIAAVLILLITHAIVPAVSGGIVLLERVWGFALLLILLGIFVTGHHMRRLNKALLQETSKLTHAKSRFVG